MKKYFLILFLLLMLQNCESTSDSSEYIYSKSTIENTNEYQFPSGTYYLYKTSSSNKSINPLEEIARLGKKGFIVKQAWYRGPLIGCKPPGAGWTTKTIYSAYFMVNFLDDNYDLSDEKYSKLNIAPFVPCGYYVDSYTLVKK